MEQDFGVWKNLWLSWLRPRLRSTQDADQMNSFLENPSVSIECPNSQLWDSKEKFAAEV